MIGATFLCILLSIVVFGYLYLQKRWKYFKERNLKYISPNILVGNSMDVLLGREHQWAVLDRLYRAFPNEEVLGHFELAKPIFLARSTDLVASVMVKDFSHFHDRVVASGEIKSPLDANMFILTGNTWRAIRNKFSPLFTSGKLKYMYQTLAGCGKNLVDALDKENGKEVDMSETMGLFAMDVIGSTAFGIEPTLLQNPNSKFRRMGVLLFGGSLWLNLRRVLGNLSPVLGRLFRIKGAVSEEIGEYFCDVVSHTLQRRKADGAERNDFVQMLLQLKEKGKIEVQVHDSGDDYLMLDKINETFELQLTDEILVGGSFTFLGAGFHATAMTLAYTIFEVSQKPEVLLKLRQEIKECVKGDEPTYEELKDMPYLEKVIKEAVRLHPTAPVLTRVCTKAYTSAGGMEMKPGDTVLVPVMSIHLDPANWPEPELFNPERFQEDSPPRLGTYLPFGEGPRICIAMRFAMMEMKFALVILLKKYNFELSEKNKLPLKMHPRIFLATPADGIIFRVTKRVN